MTLRRLFDRLQLEFHLRGMHGLAMFLSRFGSPVEVVDVDQDQRITLPDPLRVQDVLSGAGWSLETYPPKNLCVNDYDPALDTFADVSIPRSRQDIN